MERYDFTLIVPTHERHAYLKRSVEFFKNLEASVIYCDSSKEHYTGHLHENQKYMHLRGQPFAEKILVALESVDTDYVALCADDDFILHQSLYDGVTYLKNNKEYSTIVGKYLVFYDDFDGNFYDCRGVPPDVNGNATQNAKMFFSDYYQILWALYSKENVVKAFQIVKDASPSNDNFIEMVLGAISCAEGGVKFLNDVWGVREVAKGPHWGAATAPLTDMRRNKNIQNDFNTLKVLVDQITFNGYFEIVLKSYFKYCRKNNLKTAAYTMMKKVLPANGVASSKTSEGGMTGVGTSKNDQLRRIKDLLNS